MLRDLQAESSKFHRHLQYVEDGILMVRLVRSERRGCNMDELEASHVKTGDGIWQHKLKIKRSRYVSTLIQRLMALKF
jgi:hypothetical protein